jgi:glycosyltransferase involved in cell wall biosynthesis
MKPVIFLNSHPIQYFAPLYQQIVSTATIPLTVLYCSDESIKGKMDKGFGKEVKWNIPLLEGYKSLFLKNHSWKPSSNNGFFGLFNPGVISFLYKQPKSILIVHGWAYSTHILAIFFGRLFGHTVCLRTETPRNQELKKNKFITALKNIYLRFLFLFVNRFLFIGKQNELFYKALSVKGSKLIFTPYAVDNKRFRHIYETVSRQYAREKLQLPVDKKIILFSGKYISKKRPLDLITAFHQSGEQDALLVMAGDGELRDEMEIYIDQHNLKNKVLLTGFINQVEIVLYYKAADIFVMCSGQGETWGLSVNEAMNFGLPVLVSDTCGSAYDLVEDNVNGAIFETGNIQQLSSLLREYLQLPAKKEIEIKAVAFNKIDQYSYDQIISAIESIV